MKNIAAQRSEMASDTEISTKMIAKGTTYKEPIASCARCGTHPDFLKKLVTNNQTKEQMCIEDKYKHPHYDSCKK